MKMLDRTAFSARVALSTIAIIIPAYHGIVGNDPQFPFSGPTNADVPPLRFCLRKKCYLRGSDQTERVSNHRTQNL